MTNVTTEIIKLRNFERTLAKAQTTCLECLDHHEGSDFLDFFKEADAKRKEELHALRCKMVGIYKPLSKISDLLKRNEVEKIDLKDLKEEMLEIQKNIETLKEESKNRLEELKNDELTLAEEVATYENKIPEWEKPVNIKDTFLIVPKRISTSANNLCQEAKDFLYFVAKSGGHENGWPAEDHLLFIKVRNNSKTTAQLVKNLHKMLPDMSEEEITKHEQWYQKYLNLKEKRKHAIQAWRTTKNAVSGPAARKCVSAPSSKIKTKFPVYKTTKQEIAAWKKTREENLKKELEAKRLEKLKHKESEDQKKRRNEELKKEIIDWKNSKLFKIQTEKMALELARQQEKAFKAARANKLIKEFQSQDDAYVQKKKILNMNRDRAKSEEIIQPKINVPRDPSRVLKPTKNWLSKVKNDQNSAVAETPICSIRNIERLHFPEWRKGVF